MALQFSLAFEGRTDEEACNKWLQQGYEPFAVNGGRVYFRKQVWVEDDEPKSSTKPENKNFAGNERDVAK
jgi:hypothetical protein